ncbi:hypothetical protein HPULCUR_001439 [Helicostylum pulchrum]|uniref:Spore coat protein CotH n=1 Tax=Helicostylum pulchrum TaxID=562976 RepID=A0ABP9XP97_9FUNG
MYKILVCFLVYCVSYALANDLLTYHVVTISLLTPGQGMSVLIDGTHYPLQQSNTVPMLYTGPAPKSQTGYQYTITKDGNPMETEIFERSAEYLSEEQSFNDVYGQSWRKLDDMNPLPQLYAFDRERYSPLGGMGDPVASNLYEDGTVATIHISASPEQVLEMHQKKMDKKISLLADLTYINYNSIQEFKNVSFKVSGHSSRQWSKIPYKVKIPRKVYPDGLYRRWHLKLRSESTDPTMVREKLYNDVLKSTGVIAARGGYVRLYINDKPIGLFLTVDDPASSTFIRETMYGGDRKLHIGAIIKADAAEGSTTANLNYLGEDEDLYESETYEIKKESPKGHPSAVSDLIKFTKFIREYDASAIPDDARAVKIWEEHLDITSYIRQLAVEWMTGNWDAHQYAGNNYIIHRDTVRNRYVVLPVDFDYTFGNGVEADQTRFLIGKPLEMSEGQPVNSYLWDKIRSTPYLLGIYYETIKDINEQLMTPDILNAHVDSIVNLIESSIVWEQSLVTQTTGLNSAKSIADFKSAFVAGSKNKIDLLIGLKEWIKIKHSSVLQL